MRKKPVELLAPAGSPNAYKAAVAAGADAVYLGAKGFNARQQAKNFEWNDLREVIEDARIRGIKLYFVLNTLIRESEIQKAFEFASFVYTEGIDGIIVQDLGLMRIIKKKAPHLPIHASTQMTIHNTDGVKAVQALGVKRVVLSRELNLDEIKRIVDSTGIEIEVFIHGALCISRSGQCLLSSFIGGRSGNRGRCAQPCRLPWKKNGTNTRGDYLLSPKDLMALELLPQLLESGVSALKIEGRMKSPEYVAGVVSIYRKYLDLAIKDPQNYTVDQRDIRILLQIFNRGGFSTGYLQGRHFNEMLSTEHPKNWGIRVGSVLPRGKNKPYVNQLEDRRLIPMKFTENVQMGDGLEIWDANHHNPAEIVSVMMKENRHVKTAMPGDSLLVGNFKSEACPSSPVYKTYDKVLMQSLAGYIRKNTQSVPITGAFRLVTGEEPVLDISDKNGNKVQVKRHEITPKALDKPATEERIREQLHKTKDTPYFFESIMIFTDSQSYIPLSALNDMRRNALAELTIKRKNNRNRYETTKERIERNYFPGNDRNISNKREISLYFYTIPKDMVWEGLPADRVYFPVTETDHLERVQKQGIKGFVYAPTILHDEQMEHFITRLKAQTNKPDGILVGNPGMLHRIRKEFPSLPVALDFSMNVFNSWAARELKVYHPISIALSLELSMKEIGEVQPLDVALEAYVYGEIPVMTLEYCPGAGGGPCGGKCGACKNNRGFLQDRKGKQFYYITDPIWKRTTVFNSSKLMLEEMSALSETQVKIIRIGIMKENSDQIHSLLKLYSESWQHTSKKRTLAVENLQKINGSLTRGHYYRGVE